LAGVRDRPEAALVRQAERRGELLGRSLILDSAEADPDHAVLAAGDRTPDEPGRLLRRRRPVQVRGQTDLDAEPLASLLDPGAVSLVHPVQVDAVPAGHRRGEDALDVDGAVAASLLRVIDRDLAEVVSGLERSRHQEPDVDEVLEVGEAEEALQSL